MSDEMDPSDLAAVKARLTVLLFEADPMGLAGLGAPADEYSPEAGTIASRVVAASSEQDVLQIIYQEFQAWFGEDAGAEGRYARAALSIWSLVASSQGRMREIGDEC
jgi:hypothetical protein